MCRIVIGSDLAAKLLDAFWSEKNSFFTGRSRLRMVSASYVCYSLFSSSSLRPHFHLKLETDSHWAAAAACWPPKNQNRNPPCTIILQEASGEANEKKFASLVRRGGVGRCVKRRTRTQHMCALAVSPSERARARGCSRARAPHTGGKRKRGTNPSFFSSGCVFVGSKYQAGCEGDKLQCDQAGPFSLHTYRYIYIPIVYLHKCTELRPH